MGKVYKKKKEADGHGPPTEQQEQEMDIRKIMKDVEKFSYSHMTWKERKKIEDRKVVSLGGKRMILGQFGGRTGGSSKRSIGKLKPENRGLKSSEGHFRNGILDVKHLLNSAPSRDHDTATNMQGKRKGGKMKHGKKGAGKKHR
ncbi:hypothetical protein SESBI_29536 [Sesbania bispinosa]|nr:hypothetical protein SESBI_29536 [Sesbania bispinosa]